MTSRSGSVEALGRLGPLPWMFVLARSRKSFVRASLGGCGSYRPKSMTKPIERSMGLKKRP